MITNKEELREALKDIPITENQMISTMCSISVKEIEEAVDRFKYIPSYYDLLEENNKYKNIIEELEKENKKLKENRKRAIKYMKHYIKVEDLYNIATKIEFSYVIAILERGGK